MFPVVVRTTDNRGLHRFPQRSVMRCRTVLPRPGIADGHYNYRYVVEVLIDLGQGKAGLISWLALCDLAVAVDAT